MPPASIDTSADAVAPGSPAPAQTTSRAWWRYGHLWLVIAGPAVVVVASFITLWLAIRTPDPVVSEGYYRSPPHQRPARNLAPAVEGRNHAATPATPRP